MAISTPRFVRARYVPLGKFTERFVEAPSCEAVDSLFQTAPGGRSAILAVQIIGIVHIPILTRRDAAVLGIEALGKDRFAVLEECAETRRDL